MNKIARVVDKEILFFHVTNNYFFQVRKCKKRRLKAYQRRRIFYICITVMSTIITLLMI